MSHAPSVRDVGALESHDDAPTGTPIDPGLRPSRTVVWTVAWAVSLPLVLYVVLRPENYGLTPNTLDPIFYTGYSINFDDVLNAAGDVHYFVSRWSAYLPMYAADAVFGPFVGRLLWRLVLAAAILLALWGLGRRWAWTRPQQLLIGTVVLSTPMFVRAFFTDYVEYLVVALGICLVCFCLRETHRWWSAVAIGTLSGLIVIANPIAVTVVGLTLPVCVIIGARGIKGRLWLISVIGASAIFVAGAGLLLFRWRYGIDNVYQPSIDFARSYDDPVPNRWNSGSLAWLGSFTWLYATPALLLFSVVLAKRRIVRFDRVEIAALTLCAVQYLYQWFDQFVRDGFGLAFSFYWSFSLPSFLVALAVVMGRLTTGVGNRWLAGIAAAWIALLLIGVPDLLRLPSGLAFGVLAILVLAGAAALATRSTAAGLALALFLIVWTQVGAPRIEQLAYYLYLADSPRYDELFRQAGNMSETVHHEIVWFEQQMDSIVNDASTSFVVTDNWSGNIVGIYAPHVTGRRLPPLGFGPLEEPSIWEIKSGKRPILAVYGPPTEVASVVDSFPSQLGVGTNLLDVTHDSALGYRLAVFAMPDANTLPFTWTADALPIANGTLNGTEVTTGETDPPGIITFGPYQAIQPGNYQAEITYRSSMPPTATVGSADIATLETGQIPNTDTTLPGTANGTNSVLIDFVVPTGNPLTWEFRTARNGTADLTIESITLRPT